MDPRRLPIVLEPHELEQLERAAWHRGLRLGAWIGAAIVVAVQLVHGLAT